MPRRIPSFCIVWFASSVSCTTSHPTIRFASSEASCAKHDMLGGATWSCLEWQRQLGPRCATPDLWTIFPTAVVLEAVRVQLVVPLKGNSMHVPTFRFPLDCRVSGRRSSRNTRQCFSYS
ncbi:hypothetical protein F5Y18DRAFT_394413 [Xylariaceae sp. FL1019]|nr:hypothetical protein F5Y18DRAFT_394413 [Xylariaceae sp. FL1019]